MKTAQEWKELLNLDREPDAEELALLNESEGLEVAAGTGSAERFVPATPQEVTERVLVEGVGAAFRAVREEHHLTVRQAGEAWQVTSGRVSQLERRDANPQIGTIADLALRMGYRARLILEPLEGGRVIEAELTPR